MRQAKIDKWVVLAAASAPVFVLAVLVEAVHLLLG